MAVIADEPEHAPPAAEPVAHPSEASAPSVPDASAPFPSRDELVRAWGDHVIGRLRPKAKALFQAGRFVSAEGGRAQFGLPNDIHRNRCEDMRPEVEAALADQFGRPVPLVLVVDGAPLSHVEPTDDAPEPARPAPSVATDPEDDEDLAVFEADDLRVAEIDNSAEARLLQAFPGAEEVG